MSNSTKSLIRKGLLVTAICAGIPGVLWPVGHAVAGSNIWTWVSGLPNAYFVISSTTDSTWVYRFAYNPDQLYRSNNGGVTWEQASVPATVGIASLPALVPYHSERLVVVTYAPGGAMTTPNYMSTDAGTTWQPMNVQTLHIGFSYVDPDEMYSMLGNSFQISRDAGQTWISAGTLPEACTCTTEYDCMPYSVEGIYAAPSAPSTILVRLYAGNYTHFKLCRSQDHGATWTFLSTPFQWIHDIAFDPQNSGTIYAAAAGGGWKTTDGGASWAPMANGLTDPSTILVDPDNTQNLYTLNGTAVWESVDGGASWQKLDAGIPGLEVFGLAIVRRPMLHLFATTVPGSLWELDRTTAQTFSASINAGALFTKSPDVTLTLSAPAGTTQMQISNDGGFAGAVWEPFTTQKAWTISNVGETPMPRTVYVRFRTNGQISGLYLDDIVLDRTRPHGGCQINDPLGAPVAVQAPERAAIPGYSILLPALLQRHIAGMRAVTLTLTATDDNSGVELMRIGALPDLADAKSLAFAATHELYIPETSPATVYVSFVDRAGNESPIYTGTVTPP